MLDRQQGQGDGSGTMTAVIVIGGLIIALAFGAWAGWHLTALFFPAPNMTYSRFIGTLADWRGATVWHTSQPLPSASAWHWIAAILSALPLLVLIVLVLAAWHGLHNHQGGGNDPDAGLAPPRRRGW